MWWLCYYGYVIIKTKFTVYCLQVQRLSYMTLSNNDPSAPLLTSPIAGSKQPAWTYTHGCLPVCLLVCLFAGPSPRQPSVNQQQGVCCWRKEARRNIRVERLFGKSIEVFTEGQRRHTLGLVGKRWHHDSKYLIITLLGVSISGCCQELIRSNSNTFKHPGSSFLL